MESRLTSSSDFFKIELDAPVAGTLPPSFRCVRILDRRTKMEIKAGIPLIGDVEDYDDLRVRKARCWEKNDVTHVLFGFKSLEEAQAKTSDDEGAWLFTDHFESEMGCESIEWLPEWPMNGAPKNPDNQWLMPADSISFGPVDDDE